jgi:membrane associated rhomboid family serine protease
MLQMMLGPRLTMLPRLRARRHPVRPWTVVTYMFAHGGFWHIFFNMLVLFFFGPPLEARWGSREFAKYYFICGIGGAALSFLFAFHAPIIGASAAVYGVMLAFALNWPDSPIYIWAHPAGEGEVPRRLPGRHLRHVHGGGGAATSPTPRTSAASWPDSCT